MMAHGKNAESRGRGGMEYYKKRGLFNRCACWMADISSNPGTNKITKRLTNKSERQQVRQFIHKQKDIEPDYVDIVNRNFWDLV